MKLYASPTSPYVRKVAMAAIELGLYDRLEIENVDVWAPAGNPLAAISPLGKLPVLALDDGTLVYDSPVIAEYLDGLVGGRLIPAAGPARLRTLTLQALADGILDAGVARFLELHRRAETERSPKWVERQEGIMRRGFDALEAQAESLPLTVDLGMLAVLACIGWIDLRHADLDWRAGRPKLKVWFERVSDRDSFRRTVPVVPK